MARRVVPGSAEYRALFDSFTRRAFRLEALQRYHVDYEQEPLRRFLAGEPRPPDPHKAGWVARVRAAVGAGKIMQRVHVVVEPLSEYMQYELTWGYQDNVAAGEDVRIIPVGAAQWPANVPKQDYWLFDDRVLCRMRYDDKARLIAAELVDEPEEITNANNWRDAALRLAITYHEYMNRHENLLRRAS